MQNKAVFYFHFDIFILKTKQRGEGGNAIRRAIYPVPGCCGMPCMFSILNMEIAEPRISEEKHF